MYTPGASCVVGKPQYRPNVSDGFSNEEKGLRCLSWTDVEDTADGAGGAGGPGMQPTQCHQDAITALEVSYSSLCPSLRRGWEGGEALSFRFPSFCMWVFWLRAPSVTFRALRCAPGGLDGGCAAAGAERRARRGHQAVALASGSRL
jgi:hypothetical protein